jgi:glycosyltransferase involved in cell wall biosynthesis
MRILLTTDTVGGVWTFTRELSVELLRDGHEVALASFGRELSAYQQGWCEEVRRQYGHRFVARQSDAPLEWMQANDRAFGDGARVLLDLCDRFAPDVVHSSQFCWGALAIPAAKVVTAHSDVLSWAEACRTEELAESEWLCCYRQLVQNGLDGADVVTAPTHWMAEALRRNFNVPGDVRVIANGRSLNPGTCDTMRELRAVSLGRLWDEAKGLRALSSVKSPMPIVVAGETFFEGESAEMPLAFVGALEEQEVFALFRASSIYIAASIYEPFGLAPLEAALCGCAIVARDLPSFREIWGDAASYFRDERQLEGILQIYQDNPERLGIARSAAMRRAKQFSARAMARAYVVLYEELLLTTHNLNPREETVADAA